jgi:2-haloacid dehalogenase
VKQLHEVKAVTFDVFAALFDIKGSLTPKLDKVLRQSRGSVSSGEVFRVWREAQLRYSQTSTLLERKHFKFKDLTRRSLVQTSRIFNFSLNGSQIDELVDAWERLVPFPEVGGVLRRLSGSQYKIALLSNGDKEQLLKLAEILDFEFDEIFSAETVSAYKPNPAIYLQVLKKWKLKPAQVLHAAGGSSDAIGSKSVGFKTVWVNRGHAVGDQFPFRPDYVFDSMEGVLGLLPGIDEAQSRG